MNANLGEPRTAISLREIETAKRKVDGNSVAQDIEKRPPQVQSSREVPAEGSPMPSTPTGQCQSVHGPGRESPPCPRDRGRDRHPHCQKLFPNERMVYLDADQCRPPPITKRPSTPTPNTTSLRKKKPT